MTCKPELVAAKTTHARRGALEHSFRYHVDYVLLDPADTSGPGLFSRNRFNLAAIHDKDHGGPVANGRGLAWAERVFANNGLPPETVDIRLLAQPRILGRGFNPVCFWFALSGDDLLAVIVEVNNTFGDRHSYFCARPGFAPISAAQKITAPKLLHVSPFQDVAGGYAFNFAVTADRINIRIDHQNGNQGLVATLQGPRRPLTNTALIGTFLRRPIWGFRTIALIHWQALRLKIKGAKYRRRPEPPLHEVS